MIAYYPILEYVSYNDSFRQYVVHGILLKRTSRWYLRRTNNVNLRSETPFPALNCLLTTYEQRIPTRALLNACFYTHNIKKLQLISILFK